MIDPTLQLTARLALALLFAAAAVHKLRHVASFRATLEGYALLPAQWIVPAGAAVIVAELGIAIGLCLPPLSVSAALAAAALLAVYGAAIAINLRRGRRDIDCGCTGPARRQPIHPVLVARNAMLAGVALLVALPNNGRPQSWIDGVTVVAGVVSLALLYTATEGLLANKGASERLATPPREVARG
jgi:uncharacterized membrane protein YphA (DoxX/SURF4 family)